MPDNPSVPERFQYEFADFRMDLVGMRLFKNGDPIGLPGLRWKLLALLVERAPDAVPQQEVFDHLWPGGFGDPTGLLKNLLNKLKSQIGDREVLVWTKGHLFIDAEVYRRPIPRPLIEEEPVKTRSLPDAVRAYIASLWIELTSTLYAGWRLLVSPKRAVRTYIESTDGVAIKVLGLSMFVTALGAYISITSAKIGSLPALLSRLAVMPLTLWAVWAFLFRGTPKYFSRKAACLVAGGLMLFSAAGLWILDTIIRWAEPECRTFPGGCNLVTFISSASNDNAPSLESNVFLRMSGGIERPAFAVVVIISLIGIFWLLIWLFLAINEVGISAGVGRLRRYFAVFVTFLVLTALRLSGFHNSGRDKPTCADPPAVASLNVWPAAFVITGPGCNDLPLIEALDQDSMDKRSRRFALTQTEHDKGIRSDIGHEIHARLAFDNGAADNLPPKDGVARHVHIRFSLEERNKTTTLLRGELWAENASKVSSSDIGRGGDLPIVLPTEGNLGFVSGSAFMCLSPKHAAMLGISDDKKCFPDDPMIRVALPDAVFRESYDMGRLPPGWDFSGVAGVTIRVFPKTNN